MTKKVISLASGAVKDMMLVGEHDTLPVILFSWEWYPKSAHTISLPLSVSASSSSSSSSLHHCTFTDNMRCAGSQLPLRVWWLLCVDEDAADTREAAAYSASEDAGAVDDDTLRGALAEFARQGGEAASGVGESISVLPC